MTALCSAMLPRFSRFVIFDWYRTGNLYAGTIIDGGFSDALFAPFKLTDPNTYVYYSQVDSALPDLRPRYRAFGCHFVHGNT